MSLRNVHSAALISIVNGVYNDCKFIVTIVDSEDDDIAGVVDYGG